MKSIKFSMDYPSQSTQNNHEYLGIDEDSVEKLGGSEQLKYIEAFNVSGSSMEPVIKDNSVIFIDRSKTSLSLEKEKIYLVKTPKGIQVKKVLYIPAYNKIQLISQNKRYAPELFDLVDVTIIGKVVGVSSSEYLEEAA